MRWKNKTPTKEWINRSATSSLEEKLTWPSREAKSICLGEFNRIWDKDRGKAFHYPIRFDRQNRTDVQRSSRVCRPGSAFWENMGESISIGRIVRLTCSRKIHRNYRYEYRIYQQTMQQIEVWVCCLQSPYDLLVESLFSLSCNSRLLVAWLTTASSKRATSLQDDRTVTERTIPSSSLLGLASDRSVTCTFLLFLPKFRFDLLQFLLRDSGRFIQWFDQCSIGHVEQSWCHLIVHGSRIVSHGDRCW